MAGQAGAIRAGRAFVELFADDSRLVRGLKSAQRKLNGFGTTLKHAGAKMMGVGMALGAPLAAAVKTFASMGHDLEEMSKRTGISVESLSELGYAAGQSGVDMESLEKGLRKMQVSMYKAASSGKYTTDELQALGLTVADINNLSPGDMFKLIADRLSKIENPTKKAALAVALFGRAGTQLLPMMDKGAAGIQAYIDQARKLGLVMSTADAKAGAAFYESFSQLLKVLKMGAFTIGSALAPAIQGLVAWVTNAVKNFTDWIKQNKQVVETIAYIAAGALAAGAALFVFGTAVKTLATGMGVLITAAGLIHTVLGAVVSVIGMMVSPIGLVVIALGGLTAYILSATGTASKMFNWFGGALNTLKDDIATTFDGIRNAVAAGRIDLAVKILWAAIKLEWQRGVNFIESMWIGLVNGFGPLWESLKPVLLEVGRRIVDTFVTVGAAAGLALANGLTNTIKGAAINRVKDESTGRIMDQYNQSRKDIEASDMPEEWKVKQRANAERDMHKFLDVAEQTAIDEYKRQSGTSQSVSDVGKALSDIWGKPLGGLDTKAISDSLKGVGQTPEQQAKLDQLAADLAKNQGELTALVNEAKNAPVPDAIQGFEPPKNPEADLTDAMNASVRGTFNANALLGLAGGNTVTRIATATERTATAIEGLREDMDQMDIQDKFE